MTFDSKNPAARAYSIIAVIHIAKPSPAFDEILNQRRLSPQLDAAKHSTLALMATVAARAVPQLFSEAPLWTATQLAVYCCEGLQSTRTVDPAVLLHPMVPHSAS